MDKESKQVKVASSVTPKDVYCRAMTDRNLPKKSMTDRDTTYDIPESFQPSDRKGGDTDGAIIEAG